jgi:hypothetical protein
MAVCRGDTGQRHTALRKRAALRHRLSRDPRSTGMAFSPTQARKAMTSIPSARFGSKDVSGGGKGYHFRGPGEPPAERATVLPGRFDDLARRF